MSSGGDEEVLPNLTRLAGRWTAWEPLRRAALADLESLRLGWRNFHCAFKLDTFSDLLVRFADVRVAFVRHEGLAVPESVVPAEGEVQIFSYGLGMPVPILDLATSSEGISATLSFQRSPVATFVPWEAVVGIRGYGELPATPADSLRPRLTVVP